MAGHGGKRKPCSPLAAVTVAHHVPLLPVLLFTRLPLLGYRTYLLFLGRGCSCRWTEHGLAPRVEMLGWGWGWGWAWGTAALDSCQRPYIHLHCSSQRSPARQAPPRLTSARPPTSWAPPHLDCFLPWEGDLYPRLQLVRCVGPG